MAPLRYHRLLHLLPLLPLILPALALETVTIRPALDDTHACVSKCLYYVNVWTDIGSAMQCGRPYDNACYCATATPSASLAASFISACASRQCSAGDVELDMQTMKGAYASYCDAAGFTQPIVHDWLAAAATTTADDPKGTQRGETTRLTVVTATTGVDDNEGGTTTIKGEGDTLRVVDATSTLWVDSSGNAVPDPSPNDSSGLSVSAIVGIAVGVAVPVLAVIAFLICCLMRGRRNRNVNAHLTGPVMYHPSGIHQQQLQHHQSYNKNVAYYPPPPPSVSPPTTTTSSPIPRKNIATGAAVPLSPVSPPTTPPLPNNNTELSSETPPILLPNANPFPARAPQPPVQVPGTHEVLGEGDRPGRVNESRGVEMGVEGHEPVREFEMGVQGYERPRGVEMGVQGHEPAREFEMGVQGHEMPRGVEMGVEGHQPAREFEMPAEGGVGRGTETGAYEMAVQGHEPATYFEMSADARRPAELGGGSVR